VTFFTMSLPFYILRIILAVFGRHRTREFDKPNVFEDRRRVMGWVVYGALMFAGVVSLAMQSAVYYRPLPDYTSTGGEVGMTKMREITRYGVDAQGDVIYGNIIHLDPCKFGISKVLEVGWFHRVLRDRSEMKF
jgi:hypothetical protein